MGFSKARAYFIVLANLTETAKVIDCLPYNIDSDSTISQNIEYIQETAVFLDYPAPKLQGFLCT